MKDYDSTSLNARRWSEDVLDISDGVDRTRLLNHLTDLEYIVAAEQVDAMQILVNPTGPSLCPAAVERAETEDRRQRLQSTVARFARTFFNNPPSQRRLEWKALHRDCQSFPAALGWLDNLAPALDIEDIPNTDDQILNQLVERCCQIFVARGPVRARRRQEFVQTYCQDPLRWQPAIKRLVSKESLFTAKVAPWLNTLPGAMNLERDRNEPLSPVQMSQRTKSNKTEKEGTWWGWFVAASIISGILRALIRQDHTPNYSPPPRSFQSQPGFNGLDDENKKRVLEGLQRMLNEKREQKQTIEMNPPAPAPYTPTPDALQPLKLIPQPKHD